jgi:hypothetical protein
MPLTQSQQAIIAKARSVGGGKLGVALSDEACAFLVAVIVKDLGLTKKFKELPKQMPDFFAHQSLDTLVLPGVDFLALFERLIGLVPDADTYFSCLAALHKARLKYERILRTQPLPTIDQVGPRGLLQFGTLSPKALTAFLMWRKWIYDIDNRAGQETGYVFEPILAHAIGGVSVSAKKSPVRRQANKKQGRQIDCVRPNNKAYEIKIRLTIAASGQGRWKEELDFPSDSRASGYTPVLVVLDPTPNPKLHELREKFLAEKGEVYVGADAWKHFDQLAGKTMSQFLEKYVHETIEALLKEVPDAPEQLPKITFTMKSEELIVEVAGDTLRLKRTPLDEEADEPEELPDDVDEQVPGP